MSEDYRVKNTVSLLVEDGAKVLNILQHLKEQLDVREKALLDVMDEKFEETPQFGDAKAEVAHEGIKTIVRTCYAGFRDVLDCIRPVSLPVSETGAETDDVN
jgi:hypothetical protein